MNLSIKKHIKDDILLLFSCTHTLKSSTKVLHIFPALNCWNVASNYDFNYEVPKDEDKGATTEEKLTDGFHPIDPGGEVMLNGSRDLWATSLIGKLV